MRVLWDGIFINQNLPFFLVYISSEIVVISFSEGDFEIPNTQIVEGKENGGQNSQVMADL